MKLTNPIAFSVALVALAMLVVFQPIVSKRREYSRHPLPPALQAKIDNAETLLDEGRQARRDGDLATAEAKLQQCLSQHTVCDVDAALELGRIYEQQGQPEKAFIAYQQAFNPAAHYYSDFPNDVESLAHYGLLAEQHGQYAEAVRVYEQARQRLDPRPLIALNFDPQAQPTALQLSQLRAMLNVVRGIALDEQDKHQDALAAYVEAVRLQPRQAVAQYYLGYGLQKAGRSAEAKAAFAKAAQFGQGDVKAAAEKALKR